MTLEEIKAIESAAQRQEALAQQAKHSAEALARKRNETGLRVRLSRGDRDNDLFAYCGERDQERDTLMPILNAALPDLIRIAELQLAALQRGHSEHAKRLRAQIAAYFTEPVKEPT